MRFTAFPLHLSSSIAAIALILIQQTTHAYDAITPLSLDIDLPVGNNLASYNKVEYVTSRTMNTIDDPSSSVETDELTTSYSGSTGQAGNIFDVAALSDVTITSLDLNMLTGMANVTVYYKIGRYTGFETLSDNWTPIFNGLVEGQGNGVPTSLDSDYFSPISIAAGSFRSFYVTLDKPNLRYSVGSGANTLGASNDALEIYTGLGTAYPAFTNSVPNRLWNGSLRYIHGLTSPIFEDPGAGGNNDISSLEKLETTFAGGSGQAGNMFDVVVPESASLDAVIISNMAIHTLWEEEEFTIYGKAGKYSGYEMDETAWTLLGQGVVQGKGNGAPTPLPFNAFEPVRIAKGDSYAFYVTLARPNLRYTVGNGSGDVIKSNNHLQILEGIGTALPAFDAHVENRAWNGALYYSTFTTEVPSLSPSVVPSLSPTDACEVFQHDPSVFFKTTSEVAASVQFDYELVTAGWVDMSLALEVIEEEIAAEVVHYVLGCDGEHHNRFLRSRRLDGKGFVGVNQNPIDEVDDDHDCIASSVPSDNTCRAMHGEMLLYIEPDHINEIEVIVTQALSGIQSAMSSGEFENSLLGIYKVTFIGTRIEPGVTDEIDLAAAIGSQPLEEENEKSISTLGALFASAACVAGAAALATAFVLYRRITSNKVDLNDDESEFQANNWESESDYDAASRVSFDDDCGRTRAVRFQEVNGQIIGRFDCGGSFDLTEEYKHPEPGSPGVRSTTMDVHKCTSATCEKCANGNKRTRFVSASRQVNMFN